MSTYYATFTNWKQARSAVSELVGTGVSPDDLSLIFCRPQTLNGKAVEIKDYNRSVGDASYYVGREDDPVRDGYIAAHADINEFTSTSPSRISPLDTSNIGSDVESVDQMDDSQNEAEFMITPQDGISNSAHQADETALSAITGFPTASSNTSQELQNPFLQGEQNIDGLEIIEIPTVGLVIGGGDLATAALDFAKGGDAKHFEALVAQLTNEGVPEEAARTYQQSFEVGDALLAVAINMGELNESAVEEIATRNGAQNGELYDAPRW